MENFLKVLKHPITITLFVIIGGIAGLLGLLSITPDTKIASAPYVEHSWGDPNAKVVVTDYSDLQCPSCKIYYSDVEKPLKAGPYASKIKYIFKHLPLESRHPNAQIAAEAAEAAGAQGKFWEYHALLYDRQTPEVSRTWDNAVLTGYAKELGLDTNKFSKELKNHIYRKIVQDDAREAKNKGYTGTPTIEVNGKKVGKANAIATLEEVTTAINEELAKAGLPTVSPTTTATPSAAPTRLER